MSTAAALDDDRRQMTRALELARRGEGLVEPNPMVGCVLVGNGQVVGEAWHQRFGGPHAEVDALRAAGSAARGATAYVTLEPCAHAGKTPPCTRALIEAGVSRVVVGAADPNPLVDGRGVAELRQAGVHVDVGILAEEANELIAPFAKLITQRRPWVIAKWAMTLDGKLATATGSSRWISGEESRRRVHSLRGRVDAILVGRGAVAADDPLLTARPPGFRKATRVVLDSLASLPAESQLARTATEAPVLVASSAAAAPERCAKLRESGIEVWQSSSVDPTARLMELLDELGRRHMTNILVEGGAQVFGSLLDAAAIDEVHAFVAPLLAGGAGPSPVAGRGIAEMASAIPLRRTLVEQTGADIYIHGRVGSRQRGKRGD